MGNDRTLSHDPVMLDEVHRMLEEAAFFQNARRFQLKSEKCLDDLRDFIERAAERFFHSEAARSELNEAGLHRIDPDKILREAEGKIDWLHGMGVLAGKEADDALDRVSDPQFRTQFESIRQQDKKRLSGGRPELRHKFILIRQLLGRFEEYTDLTKVRTWLEIAGLFLIFRVSDVACAPAPKAQGFREKVYRPRIVKGAWKIEAMAGRSKRKPCVHFDAGACDVIAQEGCVKLADSLGRMWRRWPGK